MRDFTSFKTLGDDFNTADLWSAFGNFTQTAGVKRFIALG